MMKRQYILILLAAGLLAGCSKELGQGDRGGLVRLELGISMAEPAASTTSDTRAMVVADPLPDGTEVLVQVYAEGADPATTTVIAQGIYVQSGGGSLLQSPEDQSLLRGGILDLDGLIGGSTLPKTPEDQILLRAGTYDFYFISPAREHTAGKVSVTGGTDFMTLRERVTVTGNETGTFPLSVSLVRRCVMLDVEIRYEMDGVYSSLDIADGKNLTVEGLADAAEIPIDHETSFVATGTGYTAIYEKNRFRDQAPEMGEFPPMKKHTTYYGGKHTGIPVLPGTYPELTARTTLVIDGSINKKVQATLRNVTLEAGKYYILRLEMDSHLECRVSIHGWQKSETGSGTENMGGGPTPGLLSDGGVIYWVDPNDATHYKVMALHDAPSQLQHASNNSYSSGTSDSGMENMEIVKTNVEGKSDGQSGTLSQDYPAFDFCNRLLDGNMWTGTWYLPSTEELMPGTDVITNYVNPALQSAGGDVFADRDYWTSNQASGTDGYTVNVLNGTSNNAVNKTDTRYVRCVREIKMAVSLSERGTANSYMVHKAGTR